VDALLGDQIAIHLQHTHPGEIDVPASRREPGDVSGVRAPVCPLRDDDVAGDRRSTYVEYAVGNGGDVALGVRGEGVATREVRARLGELDPSPILGERGGDLRLQIGRSSPRPVDQRSSFLRWSVALIPTSLAPRARPPWKSTVFPPTHAAKARGDLATRSRPVSSR
jgi:hypothetical protein